MAISTSIPSSLRRPGSFHTFLHTQAGRGLVPLPLRVVLVGIRGPSGVAALGQPIQIFDATDGDAKLGRGGELALMARAAFAQARLQGTNPEIWAAPIAEPSSGASATQTATVTTSSPVAGNLILSIAGRLLAVGVSATHTANEIAQAIKAEADRQRADLPVTAAVTNGMVTFTHATRGENGNDVVYAVVSAPQGVTVVLAQGTAGSGTVDVTAALDATLDKQYDGIALANHKAADVADAVAHTTAAWAPGEKKYRWVVVGERASLATATSLASANDKTVLIITCEDCPALPCEIAAVAVVRAFGIERPNANYDGARLALPLPPAASAYTAPEIESALAGGATPLTPTADGLALKVERLVTTKVSENGAPFEALNDLAYSRTAAFLARQIDIGYATRFQEEVIDGDGELLARVRDMVIEVHRAAQTARYIRNVDEFLDQIVVEEAASPAGRLLVVAPFRVASPLHQAVFVHHHYL